MNTNIMRRIIFCLLVVVFPVAAFSAVLVSEDFESYSGGANIIGGNGGSGWGSTWNECYSFGGTATINSTDPISGTRDLALSSAIDAAAVEIHRGFSGISDNNDYTMTWSWMQDFDINAGGVKVIDFVLRNGDSNVGVDGRRLQIYAGSGDGGSLRVYDGSSHVSTLNIHANEEYNLTALFNPFTRDYSILFENLTRVESDSISGTWSLGNAGDSIDSVSLRAQTTVGGSVFYDDIRLDDGTVVPEPSTIAFFFTALLIIFGIKRKFQA